MLLFGPLFSSGCIYFWVLYLLVAQDSNIDSQGNDHRWTAAFLPTLKIPSLSRSFNCQDLANWKSKLEEVHEHAWKVWTNQLSSQTKFKLDANQVQTGGSIPEDVLEELKIEVSGLPPVKKYAKR